MMFLQILSGKKESFRCYVGFKGLIFIQNGASSYLLDG